MGEARHRKKQEGSLKVISAEFACFHDEIKLNAKK